MGLSFAAPLAGRDMHWWTFIGYYMISIHAPLAGCDRCPWVTAYRLHYFNPRTPCGVRQVKLKISTYASKFQSTHPLRGATRANQTKIPALTISIHAPLAGCDASVLRRRAKGLNFNPRTPCGVRPVYIFAEHYVNKISIHAPLAGCDLIEDIHFPSLLFISIHAPLAGCDGLRPDLRAAKLHFNPRTPCGVRLQ